MIGLYILFVQIAIASAARSRSRILWWSWWVLFIVEVSVLAQFVGFDVSTYKKWLTANISDGIQFHWLYATNGLLEVFGTMAGGYNVLFVMAVQIFSLSTVIMSLKPRVLIVAAYASSILLFMTLGNFKLALSTPFIFLLFHILSRKHRYGNAGILVFLLGVVATILHPQNLIIVGWVLILQSTDFLSRLLIGRIRVMQGATIITVLAVATVFLVLGGSSLSLFSRYQVFSGESLGVASLFEVFWQVSFIIVVYTCKQGLNKHILSTVFGYHFIRMAGSLAGVSPYIIGRGLLPFSLADIVIFGLIAEVKGLDNLWLRLMAVLGVIRLGVSIALGSLSTAL